jgi:hypothetical protein
VNPVRILLVVALCVPVLAFWPSTQGEAGEDWARHVDNACSSPRYGIRLAAARKVGGGGDAAVPAVRAWAEKHGKNALASSLVDAIADAEPKAFTEQGLTAVMLLLEEWALDRDFYWRSAAMRGIALRMPELCSHYEYGSLHDPDHRVHFRTLFTNYHDDPAWLMRTHARLGSALLTRFGIDVERAVSMPESDPRARVRLTTLLLRQGATPPLQPLFDALADDRTFHDVPWGKRLGLEAHKALKDWLGDAFPPLPEGDSPDARRAAIEALLAAARGKSGQELRAPEPKTDPAVTFVGGIELLSCKSGDVFVQWTADGAVFGGIDAGERIALPVSTWEPLQQERAALDLSGDPGVVVCDSMRLFWTQPATDAKVAPAHLPAAAAEWLTHLARSVEEAGATRLGQDLRTGLPQFAAR